MFRLEKFYPAGFDPNQYWDNRYAQALTVGKSADEFRSQQFWPLLEQRLNHDGTYLDVGCGLGGWIVFLTESGYAVKGIDTAARTVRALTEYNPDLEVKVASVTRIPYADASFDGILAVGALEYADGKIPQALSEIKRVLKPGGFFLAEVPHANLLRRVTYIPLKRLQKMILRALGKQATFANYLFDRRELRQLLEQAGFEITTEQPHEIPGEDNHYGLWIDFKILRGQEPYRLNWLGRLVKKTLNALSPWIASTGMIIVARKEKSNQ